MRRWLKGLIIGLGTGLAGVVLWSTPLGGDFEKQIGLSWLFKIRGAIEPPPEVAVVAINERAADGLGLPALPRDWPRSIHGRLVENLVQRGAAVIVFDMDFQRSRSDEDDLLFAQAVAAADRVLLAERLDGKRQLLFDGQNRQVGSVWTEQLVPPLPALAEAAKGLAPFPVPKVQVAVFQFWAFKTSASDTATMPSVALQIYALGAYERWRSLLERIDSGLVEGLPHSLDELTNAQDLRDLMRAQRLLFQNNPLLGEQIEALLRRSDIPSLSEGETRMIRALVNLYQGEAYRYLNFYGPPGTIPNIPYNALITGQARGIEQSQLDFNGKVVFIGFSDLLDPGQPDRFYSVFTGRDGVDLSGVEIAATAFGNLLTGRAIEPVDALSANILLLVLGITLGAAIYLLPALFGVPLALFLSGLYVVGAQFLFNAFNVWLPLATPILVQLPMAMFIGLVGQYLLERRRQKRISKAVSYYLPERAMIELTEKELDPNSLDKVVTGVCLATDMSGFTTLSERMAPKELADFMNAYFDSLAETLKRYDVGVTEFHADTIMSAWIQGEHQAAAGNLAAHASLALASAIQQFQERTGTVLYSRIGLAEGPFYLGHTGGGGRFGYSILGDCANTAARIEGLNKYLRTHVLSTAGVLVDSDDLQIRALGRFRLLGKSEPMHIVEILSSKQSTTDDQVRLCEQFAEAMSSFREQQWAQASERFAAILKGFPEDGPARFYQDRCRQYLTAPLWVGDPRVINMELK